MITRVSAARRIAVVVAGASAIVAVAFALVAPAASSAPRSALASTPRCAAADLGVWVAADQTGVAAGTAYFQLEFTNLSHRACTLRGFPRVAAIGSGGRQLGSPAGQDHSVAARTVRLAPAATGYAILEYSDQLASQCPSAAKRTAVLLQVIPPAQSQADHAFWDLIACTAKGLSVLMHVRVIAPGIGVRGDSG
jgi:hypothetical protein